jgi:hypothetical protein
MEVARAAMPALLAHILLMLAARYTNAAKGESNETPHQKRG